MVATLPRRDAKRRREVLDQLREFILGVASDADLRRDAVDLVCTPVRRPSEEPDVGLTDGSGAGSKTAAGQKSGQTPRTLAAVVTRLRIKQRFPGFQREWAAFLAQPELNRFGEAVRVAALADPVISGLWRDVLFGADGLVRKTMTRARVDAYIAELDAGTARSPFPGIGKPAAELLLYLWLHPACRVSLPPSDWYGAYEKLRIGFPDVIDGAPSARGAYEKVLFYLTAAVPWRVGEADLKRLTAQVRAAAGAGLLEWETKPRGATWIDPRTNPSPAAAALRERWQRQFEERGTDAETGADSWLGRVRERSVKPTRLRRAEDRIKILRRVGIDWKQLDTLDVFDDAAVLNAVVDLVRRGADLRRRELAAAAMHRLGFEIRSIARALVAPPKAVEAWIRRCDLDAELATLATPLTRSVKRSPP